MRSGARARSASFVAVVISLAFIKLEEPRFDFAVRITGPLAADAHETMTRLWLRLQATREARHFDFAKAFETVRAASRAGTA